MARTTTPSRRIIVAGASALEHLLGTMADHLHGMQPAESWDDLRQQAPEILTRELEAIRTLIAGRDSYDVIELIRQYTMPITLAGFNESENGGKSIALEIVGIIASTNRQRASEISDPPDAGRPATSAIIPHLVDHAQNIARLGSWLAFSTLDSESSNQPLSRLAVLLRSYEMGARNKQYVSIYNDIASKILESGPISRPLRSTIGFDFRDVRKVSDAIEGTYSEGRLVRLERLAQIAAEWKESGESPPEVVEEGQRLTTELFFSPGESASLSFEDVSRASSLETETVEKVLEFFSIELSDGDAHGLLWSYVNGRNPLGGRGLLRDMEGRHIILMEAIPKDHVRPRLEEAIKGTPQWSKYGKYRDARMEDFALETLSSCLMNAPSFKGFKYYAPEDGFDTSVLDRDCSDRTRVAKLVEGDGLFLIEDVAICVEVKAGALTSRARAGYADRVAADLKKTILDAASQANRLRELIARNEGLWLEDETWYDLSGVREIHSLVVCLDDFGPLAIATDALVRADLLPHASIPWIVSLHDLVVMAKLVSPAELLVYLRRRTDRRAALMFEATDELDLIMWFLSGGFYFEHDPEEVARAHPAVGGPTKSARRRHANDLVPTRVSTLTDPLDAWMYFEEGLSDVAASKPTFNCRPEIAELVRSMQARGVPGWFRFGADLLGLSSEAQGAIVKTIKRLVTATQRDGMPHTSMQNYVSMDGHAALFMGAYSEDRKAAKDLLAGYAIAKKHQLQADRALVLLFDKRSVPVAMKYMNDPYADDPTLDDLVSEMGLVPLDRMTRSIPPSARRATRQLRGKRKRAR